MRWLKRTLSRAVLLAAIAGFLLGHPIHSSKANDSLDWLASEPVTLLDLGVIRLKQDLLQVGQRLLQQGILPVAPTTGAYYDWREKKIIVFLTVRNRYDDPSEGMCVELFGRVVHGLANSGRSRKGDPSWYLEEIFTHDGWGNFTRPKNMRKQLLDAVQLEITQLPPYPMGPTRTVHCSGALDVDLEDVVVTTS